MKKLFSIMTNLQTHYHFKMDSPKLDQYAGGTCLIHDAKHYKENQLQNMLLPSRIS